MRDRFLAGTLTGAEALPSITAWEAHANSAHTRKLRNAVLGKRGRARGIGRRDSPLLGVINAGDAEG